MLLYGGLGQTHLDSSRERERQRKCAKNIQKIRKVANSRDQ